MNIKTIMTALMLSTATIPVAHLSFPTTAEAQVNVSQKTAEKQIKKAEVAKQRADKAKQQCKDKSKLQKWQGNYESAVDNLNHAKSDYSRKDWWAAEHNAYAAVQAFDGYRKVITKK